MQHITLIAFILLFAQNISGQMASPFLKAKYTSPVKHIAATSGYVQHDSSLIVKGDYELLKSYVELRNGSISKVFRDFYKVDLPLKFHDELRSSPFIIDARYNQTSTLSLSEYVDDTTIIHNNVLPVHTGEYPLVEGLDGSGALVAVIDLGIDITHDDFKDENGKTRIIALWDQFTGIKWDSSDINNGICTHLEIGGNKSHGSNVTSMAAGNGRAVGGFTGAAPGADIIFVSSNLTYSNVIAAVQWIVDLADSLGKPVAINASFGDYWGMRDGSEIHAQFIDSIIRAKSGRVFVAANGNGGKYPYHLGYQVTNDTCFTWFKYNNLGYIAYDLIADTADFKDVYIAIGANRSSGNFEFIGRTNFFNYKDRLGVKIDSILDTSGTKIATVQTGIFKINASYGSYVLVYNHSSDYHYSLMTTGSGKFDVYAPYWSPIQGLDGAEMVNSNLPPKIILPEIINYKRPDSLQTMVSGFQCLESVISVGNMVDRRNYYDIDTILRTYDQFAGEMRYFSSLGPTRTGLLKPEISASGANVICAASNNTTSNTLRSIVAVGGKHITNSGTSFSSPFIAGVVALYFQQCPNAGWEEIKNNLMLTAKSNKWIDPVPNYSSGYGQVDAFALLTVDTLGIVVNNSILDSINLCPYDSVPLEADGSLENINWSFGSSNPTSYYKDTGWVFLDAQTKSGCAIYDSIYVGEIIPPILNTSNDTSICYSDSALIWVNGAEQYVWPHLSINDSLLDSVYVAPSDSTPYIIYGFSNGCYSIDSIRVNILFPLEATFLVDEDSIYTNLEGQYHWLFDSNYQIGETLSYYIVHMEGDYSLQVTDSNGCVSISEKTFISKDNFKSLNKILTYPNPVTDILSIETRLNWENISLLDVSGRNITYPVENRYNDVIQLNLSHLSTGIYYIEITTGPNEYQRIPILKN